MEQLEVGICDDEMLVIRQLFPLVRQVVEERNLMCKIYAFDSGEALLQEVKKLNMAFLDIGMPDPDGIDIENRI